MTAFRVPVALFVLTQFITTAVEAAPICLSESLAPVGCGTKNAVVCYAPGDPAACVNRGYPYRAANVDMFCTDPACDTAPPGDPAPPPRHPKQPQQKP